STASASASACAWCSSPPRAGRRCLPSRPREARHLMSPRSVEVEPVAGALGAEISGVDLSGPLDEATVAAIRRAWLEHGVIFFRDQELPPAAFLAFARRFGEPIEYPFVKGLPEAPEIIPVLKQADERVNFGGIWHSD